MARLLAFVSIFACSAIIATILTAFAVGAMSAHPVLDFSDSTDLIGILVFGGLSAIVLAISFNASVQGARDSQAGMLTKITSMLILVVAIAGVGFGGWFGYSMQRDHESSRAESALYTCQSAIKAINDTEMEACKSMFLECEAMVDESPCHNPKSAGESVACTEQVKTAKAQLRRDMKLGRMGDASIARNELLYSCLVDRVVTTD